jgi:SHS2 domain-containing protein
MPPAGDRFEGSFEEEEHPSDALLRIRAATLEGLFGAAARACFAVMTDLGRVRPRIACEVRCDAAGLEDLLVVWLNELIGVSGAERLFFSEFDVRALAATRIEAVARGEPIDPERHLLLKEVKAATYHRLSIATSRDGWEATVLLDI